jgi:hypothetical protein
MKMKKRFFGKTPIHCLELYDVYSGTKTKIDA